MTRPQEAQAPLPGRGGGGLSSSGSMCLMAGRNKALLEACVLILDFILIYPKLYIPYRFCDCIHPCKSDL